MAFVQVIQYRTAKIDEMRKVGDEWQEAVGNSGTAQRVMVCGDRDNRGQYFTLAFFDSYDAAMENSNHPTTQEYSQRMMSLADGPPTFYNLDILDDRQIGLSGIEPKFGWLSPVASHAGSNFQPIVRYQEEHILPQVLPHFDSVWIADHFYGFDPEKKEGFLEGWTTLTWLAARHPNVGLCHHVLGHGYRNPALTAKMASTLQVLSGGRFMLGIGAGWREDEYRGYGYDFPKVSVRLRQLEEVVQICRLMWTDAHPTFTGRYFRIDDAAATPRPDVVPRICIGSGGEQIGLPIVGRQADVWNGPYYGSDDDWRRKRGIVDRAAVDAGRDPGDIESCVTVAGELPDDDAASEQWFERLTHLRELGITYFVLDFGHPLGPEPALRFAAQVIAPMKDA